MRLLGVDRNSRVSLSGLPAIVRLFCCFSLLALVAGCGGGGATGSGGGSLPGSFTLSLSANTVTLTATAPSQSIDVTLTGQNGFNSSATCTLGGLPSAVMPSPATFVLSSGASQKIMFSLDLQLAQTGTTAIKLNCSAGTTSANASISLTVQVTPGLSMSLTPASITIDPGQSQSVQVNAAEIGVSTGVLTGTVTNLPAGISVSQPQFSVAPDSYQTLKFTAASSGTVSSGNAAITISGGSFTAAANLPITVNTAPDFSLFSGIYTVLVDFQGAATSFTLSATPYNGFNSPIAVSFTGLPSGVTFTPSALTLIPGTPQTIQVTASLSAPTTSGATVTISGTGGGVTRQSQFTVAVDPAYVFITAQPSSLSIPAGSVAALQLQVTGVQDATGMMSVQLTGAPPGVTLSQSSFSIPGSGALFDVYVEASSSASSGMLTATATYGPATQSVNIPLTIGAAEAFPPVPLTTSDLLVRADALTPYKFFPEPNYVIYHAATNRFFSTDAYLNQLNVVDANTHALTATIAIPGAFGLDQAPDGSVIYVGTEIGDLYVVDPVHLSIIKRYPTVSISPYGFQANAVYALADGKLLLERYFLLPGYSWVDGNGPLALWNPATNDIKVFTNSPPEQMPTVPTCLAGFENAILTNNRTRILLAPILTSEGSSTLCSLDPETDTWVWSGQLTGGQGSALTNFAVSADGTVLAAFDGYNVYNLDPATLTVKNQFVANTTQSFLDFPGMFLSQDKTKVFLSDSKGADILDQFDLATGAMTGWLPTVNLVAQGSYSLDTPFYQAMSSAGLAAGVLQGGGIGLLDTNAVHAPPIGSHFGLTELQVPYGPTDGGMATSWSPDGVGVPAPPLGSVYFGANAATDLNNAGLGGMLEAVTPAGSPGPVDVRTFTTDGGSQYLPLGFSYGPSVLEAATNFATADGGTTASMFGFGFGPLTNASRGTYAAPPLDLQATVGGAPVTVQGFNSAPYGSVYFQAPPFPAESILYSVPPGPAGTTANLAVTNLAGSTSAATQITYLPATKQYPVDGVLADGVYDPHRDVYYFTDASQVRVFSATKAEWLPPIPIPEASNPAGAERLYGIALSPDGSRLAISDVGAIAIYLLNPDTPSSIQTFALGINYITEVPTGVAVTNSGTVYFATADLNGDGPPFLLSLNSTSGAISSPAPSWIFSQGPDPDGRPVLTADGSRLFIDDEGMFGYLDVASGQFTLAPQPDSVIDDGSDEMVLAANQTSVFASGIFADSGLNGIGIQALDVAESVDAQYVYGAALSMDGSLFFQPGANFIDLFNGYTGAFRGRIALPVALSPNFRALVANGRDSTLVAITGTTGNGVAVIDLNSLPEPAPPSYLPTPASAPRLNAFRQQANAVPMSPAGPQKLHARKSIIHRQTSPLIDAAMARQARLGISSATIGGKSSLGRR